MIYCDIFRNRIFNITPISNKSIYLYVLFPLRVQMLKDSPDGKDITLIFPKGKSLYEVDWLGFISRKKKVFVHYDYLQILRTNISKTSNECLLKIDV